MTFSICVREPYEDDSGTEHLRFGVAVASASPGIGAFCPHVSENGAIATQSLVNVELGKKGIQYVDDVLSIEDTLRGLLNADSGQSQRQVHGVDAKDTFAHTGSDCSDWSGHSRGENYTVAGNLLTDSSVVEAIAESYELSNRDERLSKRLIDALEAGHAAGGDRRETKVQSAALIVNSGGAQWTPYFDNLRVDATETPLKDLREAHDLAVEGYEHAVEEYGW